MSLPEYERLSSHEHISSTVSSINLPVIEEGSASAEVTILYEHFRSHFGRPDVPGILKCFATHPPLLEHMMALSESLIFSDGHLGRRQKEMIATLISSQNECEYCADSHGYFLRVHGGTSETLEALQRNNLTSHALTLHEQSLLTFAQKVNLNSSQIRREDVDCVLLSGWSELQIAEAVHVVALFSTFNRVANAFGLKSQGLLDLCDHENIVVAPTEEKGNIRD